MAGHHHGLTDIYKKKFVIKPVKTRLYVILDFLSVIGLKTRICDEEYLTHDLRFFLLGAYFFLFNS